jgi:hypothetical protein
MLHSFLCPPLAPNIDQLIMLTCQATGREQDCQQKEAQEAEYALQQKLKEQRLKQQQAKLLRNKERKKEEEQRKKLVDKQCKAKELAEKEAALAQLVSPSLETAQAVPTTSLLAIMNDNVEDEGVGESTDSQSPS